MVWNLSHLIAHLICDEVMRWGTVGNFLLDFFRFVDRCVLFWIFVFISIFLRMIFVFVAVLALIQRDRLSLDVYQLDSGRSEICFNLLRVISLFSGGFGRFSFVEWF